MMRDSKELTQAEALSLFIYEAGTGVLYNRVDRGPKARKGFEAGCRDQHGYRRIGFDGKTYLTHRVIWLMVHGSWPADQIDHVNGNGTDNRLMNLRAVSHAENMRNLRESKINTSGITGVSWSKRDSLWVAQIQTNGVNKHVGGFKEKTDAIKARKAAERKHGFHPNHGNPKHHQRREG